MSTPAVVTSSEIAIKDDQVNFTPEQIGTLQRYLGAGVKNANSTDFTLLFQQVRRTGLDPFSRQIYLIMRMEYDKDLRGSFPKPTIQIGIDGFRLIANRAARSQGVRISHHNPLWQDENGQWFDSWAKPTPPVACRYKVSMTDGAFVEMTVMYAEYVPLMDEHEGSGNDRKKTGRRVPMGLWTSMPASQLAKCAEAVTLRKAFPQDLSGLYEETELERNSGVIDVSPVTVADRPAPDGSEPAEPLEPRNWIAEIEAADSPERVTELWSECREKGQYTRKIDLAIRAKAATFKQAPEPPAATGACILTGADGENADDCTTHDHALLEPDEQPEPAT